MSLFIAGLSSISCWDALASLDSYSLGGWASNSTSPEWYAYYVHPHLLHPLFNAVELTLEPNRESLVQAAYHQQPDVRLPATQK